MADEKGLFYKIFCLIYSLLTGVAGIYYLYQSIVPYVKMSPILSSLIGINFLIISIFGLIAIYLQREKLFKIYSYFIIFQILISAIFLFVVCYKIKHDYNFKNQFAKKLNDYLSTSNIHDLDKIQQSLQCCGLNSVEDYIINYSSKNVVEKIPKSCCIRLNEQNKCDKNSAFHSGCYNKYYREFNNFQDQLRYVILLSLAFHCRLGS